MSSKYQRKALYKHTQELKKNGFTVYTRCFVSPADIDPEQTKEVSFIYYGKEGYWAYCGVNCYGSFEYSSLIYPTKGIGAGKVIFDNTELTVQNSNYAFLLSCQDTDRYGSPNIFEGKGTMIEILYKE